MVMILQLTVCPTERAQFHLFMLGVHGLVAGLGHVINFMGIVQFFRDFYINIINVWMS